MQELPYELLAGYASLFVQRSDQYERFSLQKGRDFSNTFIRQNF